MGMIILPVYIGAIIIVIKCLLEISRQFSGGMLNPINIVYGIIIMLLIYGLIVLSYYREKKSWALSPVFRFPTYMIYIPYLILVLARNLIGLNLTQVYDSLLISIAAAGLFMVVFHGYVFGILGKLGKDKHY